MKTRYRAVLSAIIVVPLLFAGPVAAIENNSTTPSNSGSGSSSHDKVAVNETATPSQSVDDSASLQKRLDNRKNELKVKLTAVEQQKIQLKCKASQGNISSLKGRINGIETSRTNVHRELVDRLTKLGDKVKAQNVDITELQKEIDALKSQISTFDTDLAAYKQAVSDLTAMDCAKDPTAFKASLLAARAAHDKVAIDAKNIRSYVNDTIKPTLQQLRKQLEDKKAGA
jgi:chromosome segregation ATPase